MIEYSWKLHRSDWQARPCLCLHRGNPNSVEV